LLAVSGGVDSMVMACLFSHSAIKCRLAIAHCNFHLRGADSDSDEALVREYAGNARHNIQEKRLLH
jgi:tRNA(Ile)-lysidine synthase